MKKNVISVSTRALVHLKKILVDNNASALTFAAKSGGCNGFEYDIKSTNKPLNKRDELYEKDGVTLHVCGKSLFHILGTEIDWKDDLMGACFVFKNPIATSSCGCGTSFNTTPPKDKFF